MDSPLPPAGPSWPWRRPSWPNCSPRLARLLRPPGTTWTSSVSPQCFVFCLYKLLFIFFLFVSNFLTILKSVSLCIDSVIILRPFSHLSFRQSIQTHNDNINMTIFKFSIIQLSSFPSFSCFFFIPLSSFPSLALHQVPLAACPSNSHRRWRRWRPWSGRRLCMHTTMACSKHTLSICHSFME